MASKQKSKPKDLGIPKQFQLLGDEILDKKGLDPARWREEQVMLAKLNLMQSDESTWAADVLYRAYAELIVGETFARSAQQASADYGGGED